MSDFQYRGEVIDRVKRQLVALTTALDAPDSAECKLHVFVNDGSLINVSSVTMTELRPHLKLMREYAIQLLAERREEMLNAIAKDAA